jgi:hypothetical protein
MPRTLGHGSSACQLKRLILKLICRGQARMVMGDGRGEVHMDRRSAIALRTSFDAKVHAGFESGAWRRKQILRELHGPHSPASLSKPEVAKNPLDESAGPSSCHPSCAPVKQPLLRHTQPVATGFRLSLPDQGRLRRQPCGAAASGRSPHGATRVSPLTGGRSQVTKIGTPSLRCDRGASACLATRRRLPSF